MSSNRTPISAVALDYGGVLASHIDEYSLCHMAAAAGAPLETFRRALWELRPAYDANRIDGFSYWRAVLEQCGRGEGAGEGLGDDKRAHRDIEATIELLDRLDALGWSRMNLAMFRWVESLGRAGYHTLIISNMSIEAYEVLIRDEPWAAFFEYILVSGHIGVNKPDPAIFEKALIDLDFQAQSVLFVDDRADNVSAARQVGMRALQFVDAPPRSPTNSRGKRSACRPKACAHANPHSGARSSSCFDNFIWIFELIFLRLSGTLCI